MNAWLLFAISAICLAVGAGIAAAAQVGAVSGAGAGVLVFGVIVGVAAFIRSIPET